MLHFNELKLSPDNKCLIIDVEINNLEYYQDVVLDSIVIDTQDTFVNNGPSDNPLFSFSILDNLEDEIIPIGYSSTTVEDTVIKNKKHYRLEISIKDLKIDIDNTMLFVYTLATGIPKDSTPCGYDNKVIMGTVINTLSIYKDLMSHFREMNECCSIPKGLIDSILRVKSLDLSIRTGNYFEAIRYWEKFFKGNSYNNINNNCNCNG